MSVIYFIFLYGAYIWASEAAALVIMSIPPIDQLATERKRVYKHRGVEDDTTTIKEEM